MSETIVKEKKLFKSVQWKDFEDQTKEQVNQVVALFNTVFQASIPTTASRSEQQQAMDTERNGKWLLLFDHWNNKEEQTVLVGFCTFRLLPANIDESGQQRDYLFLYNVAVHPDHRRRGVATQMLNTLLSAPLMQTVDATYLFVTHENQAAIGLYKKFGFQKQFSFMAPFCFRNRLPAGAGILHRDTNNKDKIQRVFPLTFFGDKWFIVILVCAIVVLLCSVC